jgi:RNA polymerase sigma factor for flagellar operon FliA
VRVVSVSLDEPKKRPVADSAEVLALVTAHIDLVDIVARSTKRMSPRADFDDLVGSGREGLLGAARAFDPAHGVPFRSFASFRIRGAMMDHMRTSQNVSRGAIERIRAFEKAQQVSEVYAEEDAALPGPRSPEEADKVLAERLAASAAAMAIGLLMASGGDAIDVVADNVDVEERLEQRILLGKIEKIMEERPEAEREILRLHYFEDLSLEEVGARLGLHKSWVSRVMTRAVEALARRLGDTA